MSTTDASSAGARIAPWLSVSDAQKAVDFYTAAFGASELYRLEDDDQVIQVAQLAIGTADFWVQNDPDNSPAGHQSVRMIVTVEDPDPLFDQALAAGGAEVSAMSEGHGWRIGRLADPFGHHWEVGKQLPE